MKLEDKIYASIGLTVFLTIAYYYAYSFVELYVSKLCDKYVCFEFPPYADFLAVWTAIIGLYFVVTSLDAWKQQDKYNNSKNRIALLNDLKHKIEFDFGLKICSFYETNQGENEKKVLRMGLERDYIISSFNAYLEDTNILEDVRKLDRENYYTKNCLYQNDFDKVIELAYKYIWGCCNEIRKLNLTEDDTKESYQNSLTQIYKRHRNHEYYFKKSLNELNDKLNKFIE